MAEFSLLRGFVDKRSYLDIDDINGPGLRTYKKISAFSSVDFALFKIQGFSLSESPSDRKKFVIELPNTIEDLGQAAYQYLDPILTSIVIIL
jgi:hypothetical protein